MENPFNDPCPERRTHATGWMRICAAATFFLPLIAILALVYFLSDFKHWCVLAEPPAIQAQAATETVAGGV